MTTKRKPTVTALLEPLKDADKVKLLEPEIALLRLQLNQHRYAMQQCVDALRIVATAMAPSNEWPQTRDDFEGVPVTGGHIFRAVTCALETAEKAKRSELKLEQSELQKTRLVQ